MLKRAQELSTTPQEQAALLNLVSKVIQIIENLVVAPGKFDAAVSIQWYLKDCVKKMLCFTKKMRKHVGGWLQNNEETIICRLKVFLYDLLSDNM